MKQDKVTCCIAGGGPAGLMLGVLLARAGVRVQVLEKHADFLRDFRGDTIHPSTLEVMHELGWLDEFLRLPHQKVARLAVQFGEVRLSIADFSHLPVVAPYIAFMPQWDFLNFLAVKGRTYPGFELAMDWAADDLMVEGERVVGIRASTPEGPIEIRAELVVAADGRQSVLREKSGLESEDFGAPMDVLWFRLPRRRDDTSESMGRFDAGRIFIKLYRGDYWQCAFVIPKGGVDKVHASGLPAFRVDVARLLAGDAAAVETIVSWEDVKLLTVQVDRLKRWYRPGFLCIGDAAHAMSPIGGVGINLAVQDAVAAANILAEPLLAGTCSATDLAAVERRRRFPTRATQALQLMMQNRVIAPILQQSGPFTPPLAMRLLARWPLLRRLPARLIGLGVQREHVGESIQRAAGRRL